MTLHTAFSSDVALDPAVQVRVERKTKAREETRNRSLHGLRGLASLLVLLFHVQMMGGKGGFWGKLTPDQPWSDLGPIAVRLFFFISGFLIVGSLWRNGDVKRFLINRVLRIYPVFGLLHLVMFGLGPLINYQWAGGAEGDSMGRLAHDPLAWVENFGTNFAFLPGALHMPIAQQNAWSLAYEVAFYLVAAAMFLVRAQKAIWATALWWLGWAGIAAMCISDKDWTFFVGGVGVWWLHSRGAPDWFKPGPLDLLTLALGFWLYHTQQWVPCLLVLGVFFFCVVTQRGWMTPLLQSSWMTFLGTISYSLYLIHPFALDALRRVLNLGSVHQWVGPAAPWIFVLLGPVCALVAAWASYVLVEKHFTKWLTIRLGLR